MLVEFSIIPVGRGESIGEEIAKVISIVAKSGLPYRVNPMGTVVEGEWDEVMAVIKKCHEEVIKASARAVSTITIDDRPSKPLDRLTEKLKSIEKRLGREVKK
ncbi:MAG: MTH1187 family thiamine-binding protein [Deltaproteobacteria bacterium]|nr:MTH1187 family thiamine-binding protein [Deltaproteobacteria bacterium]